MTPRTSEGAGEIQARSEVWRLFVAVPLWGSFRELARLRHNELLKLAYPFRWVRPEHWHLTLHFLGDTPISKLELLKDSLTEEVSRIPSFRIEVGGLGGFPRLSKARVLWVGVRVGAERLVRLAEAAKGACVRAGCPGDKKRFEPHLTLARAKQEPLSVKVPPEIHAAAWGVEEVRSITLVRSELARTGPTYTPLVEVLLGPRAESRMLMEKD